MNSLLVEASFKHKPIQQNHLGTCVMSSLKFDINHLFSTVVAVSVVSLYVFRNREFPSETHIQRFSSAGRL